MTPLRNLLSHNHFWRQLRNLQGEGFYSAYDRIRLWSRILKTPPVITESLSDRAPVAVHTLTYHRDYLTAIWALKSFYHYSGVSYPLIIHLQGRTNSRMIARLGGHFPNAVLITQAQADVDAKQWLTECGYPRLLEARHSSIMMMKLIDFNIICHTASLLAIDSDVIFFRRPDELLRVVDQPLDKDLFMHDTASWYNISEDQAITDLRITLAPRVNCGVMLLSRDERRLARCEDYLAHPSVSRPSSFIEQTMYALYASEQDRVGYLPDNYYVSPGSTSLALSNLVCRHYAGPSRQLLTDEGIPGLIRTGFLEEILN